MAYALCGDWHQADDLLQTALVKLYVAWPRVRRDGREEAYVRRILVRTQIDETRRPHRREVVTGDVPDHPVDPSDDWSDLFAALQALPMMQRKVVVLRHWLGLSTRETAEELGISEGTVKSHSSRAVGHLREHLVHRR